MTGSTDGSGRGRVAWDDNDEPGSHFAVDITDGAHVERHPHFGSVGWLADGNLLVLPDPGDRPSNGDGPLLTLATTRCSALAWLRVLPSARP